MGLRVTAGKLPGVNVEPGAVGLESRNANVADGDGEGVPDGVDEEKGEGLGVALGVGEGGIIFSHLCKGTLAPPISLTSASQRVWIFSKSGGPNGFSAVPGKIM